MKTWMIIDGYNLIFSRFCNQIKWPADPNARRRRLISMLDEMAGALADRVTVVFDGQSGDGSDEAVGKTVEVLFSTTNQSADCFIERLVRETLATDTPDVAITVVTSDRAEREVVAAGGAETISCSTFAQRLQQSQDDVQYRLRSISRKAPPICLGDFFPSKGF